MALMKVRWPKWQLFLLFLYFSEYFICALNSWWFVSYERALLGNDIVNAHIGFNVVGTISFGILSSPFLFMPYRYGAQMTKRSRRNSSIACMGTVFLLHDWPLWLMEFYIVWQYGWIHVLQGVSISLLTITTTFGFFGVWLGYAWKVARVLQQYYGSGGSSLASIFPGRGHGFAGMDLQQSSAPTPGRI